MRKSIFVGFGLLVSRAGFAGTEARWTYLGEGGPEHWAKLSPGYCACGGSFSDVLQNANNRPVQPANARPVL